MTLTHRFNDFARNYPWTHFVVGSLAFLSVVTLFDFFNQRAGDHAAAKFAYSAVFSAEILGAGLLIGVIFGGIRRLIYGAEQLVQMRETALWIACLFGVACVIARLAH